MLVDYDIFVNVKKLDAKDLKKGAAGVQRRGLRLPASNPITAAVDKGVDLPDITDGFAGRAPDSGGVGGWPGAAPLRSTQIVHAAQAGQAAAFEVGEQFFDDSLHGIPLELVERQSPGNSLSTETIPAQIDCH